MSAATTTISAEPPANLKPAIRSLTLTRTEIAFYKSEGYLYLPGLVSVEDADSMRREVLHIMNELGWPVEKLRVPQGSTSKLIQSREYLRGSRLDALANSIELREIASQLMGGLSTLYMPFTAVKGGGGSGRFHFHQDNQYTRFVDGLLGINIWFALQPMTPENGCLQIVPRSHLRGTLDSDLSGDGDTHKKVKIEPESFLPIRMSPGDAVAFTRLTVHGSGPNATNEPRIGYAVQYHRDDVQATWDNQPPRLLKGANRWSNDPVEKISTPKPEKLDGH